MYILWGELYTPRQQIPHRSVIITNHTVTRHGSVFGYDDGLREHYQAASFLLPLSSICVLGAVVLLMVLFKRCPHVIAGLVIGLLGSIILFIIYMSINNAPIYT
ncbi:uncharacterized protein LOC105687095 [Athalia rosae]|uniref:uncharacterized protein LOC105687095 n=1 Tax=Athalia rosae TaxID=37344 RepID=UPI000626944F|nr:uncharacterized protein LOC105687095 [Athalia rosae]